MLNGPVTLRPYQHEAIAAIEREHGAGRLRTLIVMATGTGKTTVFAEWARMRVALGRRLLVLAHRTELLEQAAARMELFGLRAAIEQADRRAGRAPVVVASVQTLRGKRLAAFDPNAFDVIIDEAHHTNAKGYRSIVDHFAGARVLGVTATPDRGDGQALGDVFESCAYRFEIREAIAAGYLAPIRCKQVHVEGVDLSSVKTRAGDLAQDQLSAIMAEEQAVVAAVDALLREAGDRKTIVFTVDVAHATAITEAINRYRDGAARMGYGELAREERAVILDDFKADRFQFLVNCQLWTEGFDEPSITCVATMRPTKSRALVVQCVGRGTRLFPGKTDLLWLDFVGNAGKHKLVGPLDALAAGDVPEDVRKEAERLLSEDACDVDEALDEAARILEERRRAAKVTASARYFATEVDPFFGAELAGAAYLGADAGDPATHNERQELIKLGMKKLAVAPLLTKGEVKRVTAAAEDRRRKGLCSYKQAKLLRERLGIDAREMKRQDAGARISILERCDWDASRARVQIKALEAKELLAKNGGDR
ncbi:MAG TPA: DEAD/DEAH box helicase [Kofleriaceae bacterium]|nr:DEAD/DEAH box helicase [Kofleriaceae bacterium]